MSPYSWGDDGRDSLAGTSGNKGQSVASHGGFDGDGGNGSENEGNKSDVGYINDRDLNAKQQQKAEEDAQKDRAQAVLDKTKRRQIASVNEDEDEPLGGKKEPLGKTGSGKPGVPDSSMPSRVNVDRIEKQVRQRATSHTKLAGADSEAGLAGKNKRSEQKNKSFWDGPGGRIVKEGFDWAASGALAGTAVGATGLPVAGALPGVIVGTFGGFTVGMAWGTAKEILGINESPVDKIQSGLLENRLGIKK